MSWTTARQAEQERSVHRFFNPNWAKSRREQRRKLIITTLKAAINAFKKDTSKYSCYGAVTVRTLFIDRTCSGVGIGTDAPHSADIYARQFPFGVSSWNQTGIGVTDQHWQVELLYAPNVYSIELPLH